MSSTKVYMAQTQKPWAVKKAPLQKSVGLPKPTGYKYIITYLYIYIYISTNNYMI